jgi:hypothetical protein
VRAPRKAPPSDTLDVACTRAGQIIRIGGPEVLDVVDLRNPQGHGFLVAPQRGR